MDNAELSSGRQSMQPNLVLTNTRTSFSGRTLPGAALHRGLAWGDFDRDGRVDLVVTRLNQPAQILWNRSAGSNRWIDVDLRGTKSNRDAIGAWVEVDSSRGKAVGPCGGFVRVRVLFQSPIAFRARKRRRARRGLSCDGPRDRSRAWRIFPRGRS